MGAQKSTATRTWQKNVGGTLWAALPEARREEDWGSTGSSLVCMEGPREGSLARLRHGCA